MIMFENWRSGYLRLFDRLRPVSIGAALILTVISVLESGRVFVAIYGSESFPASGLVFDALISPLLIFTFFVIRLIYLSLGKITLLWNFLTFSLCVFFWHITSSYSMHRCWINCPENTVPATYDMLSSFPLVTVGLVFVFFGAIKFLLIAFLALLPRK